MTTNQKTIIIKPITAQLTRNTDLFKNMDPYVKFILGVNKAKSSVHKRAGKNPNWKDEIIIKYMNEDTLKIEVWDKDTFKPDDLVGSTSLNLRALEGQKDKVDWIGLTYKGKDAGKILLDIQFPHLAEKEQANTSKPEFTAGGPVSGIMVHPSMRMPPNGAYMPNAMSMQMPGSINQQPQPYAQQQQSFNTPIQPLAQPAQPFKPGQWPQDPTFEWSTSVYVPHQKFQ